MFRSSSDHSLGRSRVAGALAALASAVAAACVTFPRAPDEGGSPWIAVDTPHFALATDLDKAPAEDLARMLEDTWTAMEYALQSLPGGALEEDVPGSEPVLVIALRNDREREAVHKRSAGIFSAQTLLPPAVYIGDINANRSAEVLQHELAHALLSKRLPRVPRWLNEGIAVYLQTAELDRDRHAVKWGIWSEHVMRTLREYGYSRVSVDALFDSERWKSSGGTYALEIEAGLLVHMLVNRNPGQLACYLKGLATDLDPNAAMACFPDRTRWTYEVKEYAYDASVAGKQASIEFPNVQVSSAPLGDARVHAVLAMLDYMVVSFVERQFQADRFARAQRHLARALDIDPAEQLAILLTLTQTDQSTARRAELTQRLVDRHPNHWATWIARAGVPDIPAPEQFAAIDRAWALAPGRTEVIGWAASRAFAESRWFEARTLAIKAWLGGNDSDENRALVYAALVQIGSCAEAESWLPPPKDRKAFIARVGRMRGEINAASAPCPIPP
jgi:hypothetical protein